MTPSTPLQTPPSFPMALRTGVILGGKAGLMGSSLYIVLYCVGVILSGAIAIRAERSLWPVVGAIGFSLLAIYIGAMVGIIPALLIGSGTGMLISISQYLLWNHMTLRGARLLGGLSCGVFALFIHMALQWPIGSLEPMLFAFLLGIPTVIYIGLGIWLSGRLFITFWNATTVFKEHGHVDDLS